MCELRRQKNDIRAGLIERRKNISPEKQDLWDKKIANIFFGSISYRFCDVMLIYVSTKFEISTSSIMERALEQKKIVGCPVSNTENNTLSFKVITSTSELKAGSYNILEPPKINPDFKDIKNIINIADSKNLNNLNININNRKLLAICVVPCLSYDSEGYRIGYGKGYYDRFLSSFEGTKIGLCYSEFKSAQLPKGKYDVKLDVVITEKGVTVL